MRRVYKYPLDYYDHIEVDLPLRSGVLHFGIQDDVPTIWVLVDAEETTTETRRFRMAGTGHDMEEAESWLYVGTAIQPPFVWHLFEVER